MEEVLGFIATGGNIWLLNIFVLSQQASDANIAIIFHFV